jgi:GNAT superfamily N-acetyltransferase
VHGAGCKVRGRLCQPKFSRRLGAGFANLSFSVGWVKGAGRMVIGTNSPGGVSGGFLIKIINMITIRQALPSDTGSIIDFQEKMAWETEKLVLNHDLVSRGVAGVFDKPARGRYYVAEIEGVVVASLLITYEWSDWRDKNVWWFQSVYVLEEHRRAGVFRKMYTFIKNEAVKNDVAGLRLYVESNNRKARLTYEALGMSFEHYTMYEWLRD